MTFEEFKEKYGFALNEQQEAAVLAVGHPVLLLAVPGSGKTTVLVERLGYLTQCCNVPPENILVMTYTVAATNDMRRRFISRFGAEKADRIDFRTINGFSAWVIRLFAQLHPDRVPPRLIDEKNTVKIVGEIYRRVCEDFPTEGDIKNVSSLITYIKNMMLKSDEIASLESDCDIGALFSEYEKTLRERGEMDFDDQMVFAYRILSHYPDVLRSVTEKYTCVCVDEAQDTSKIQHEIIKLITRDRRDIFMVGDEDQSIYGFRAAYPQALTDFRKFYPDAEILFLEKNYRSTSGIVDRAARFIKKNKDRYKKTMISARGDGADVNRIALPGRKSQYPYLCKIAEQCDRQTAVLFRDNESALPLIDLFTKNNIDFACRHTDTSFFTNRIVNDVTDILSLSLNPMDAEVFGRIYYKLGLGISKEELRYICLKSASENIPLARAAVLLSERGTKYKKRREFAETLSGLSSLCASAAVYSAVYNTGYSYYLSTHRMDMNKVFILLYLADKDKTIRDFFAHLNDLRDTVANIVPNDSNFILSTVHSSKGLEYDRVFLLDIKDGLFPKNTLAASGTNAKARKEYEEERRLFYVAATRAKNELNVFTFSDAVSSFAEELLAPIRRELPAAASGPAEYKIITDSRSLRTGLSILHKKFGRGTVRAVTDRTVNIAFESGSEKQFYVSVLIKEKLLSGPSEMR